MVTANPGLKRHLHDATSLINQSLSHNTLKGYHAAWKSYHRFLEANPGAIPGDLHHILAFISYCHTQLKLSYNTIRLYLAGIQHFTSFLDPNKPSLFATHAVKAILRGIHKQKPQVSGKRLPVTSAMFRVMSTILSRSPFGFCPAWSSKLPSTWHFMAFYDPANSQSAAPVIGPYADATSRVTTATSRYTSRCPKHNSPVQGLTSSSSERSTPGAP